ncbi:MAG: HEAT repeat domain-containing protein [Planctomycetes bacterium]|nr:HEAT repeat domain-containing protein [Planctomycetota bacterium]
MLVPWLLSFVCAPFQDTIEARTLARMRAHYQAAEAELRAADVDHLDAARRAERERLIEVLAAYRERGDFGRLPGAGRVPQFVDAGERRCAVAELLFASGRDDLVELVRTLDNDAWVLDLECNDEFLAWLERSGLTLAEAARIQLPATGGIGVDTVPPPSGRRGYSGPGDTLGGSGGSGKATPTPAAPTTPEPSSGPASGPKGPTTPTAPQSPASPITPRALAAEASDEATWWMWWEYNKLAYLPATPLAIELERRTGEFDAEARRAATAQELDALRQAQREALASGVRDDDAVVRAEAVIALARLGAAPNLELLLGALTDRSLEVRHRAILALGVSGSPKAFGCLESLARTGAVREGGPQVSTRAREFALLGLALGRRAGSFDVRADRAVFEILIERKTARTDSIVVAALAYHALAPSPELETAVLSIAKDAQAPTPLRARAIESLSSVDRQETLSALQHWLSGAELELRRSAALVLGRSRHDLALPPLMTAFEVEVEPLTKGFLLVSIGEQGGTKARDFLIRTVEKGDAVWRPWAALGLGILARNADDAVARDAVRRGVKSERNADAIGAYRIGAGLARDRGSVPELAQALVAVSDPRQRMYAATALGLVGDEAALKALRARLDDERSPLVRVAIAQALGHCGKSEDAPRLVSVLGDVREPALQGLAAVAMAFHGSRSALVGLTELSRAESTGAASRAAALNGIGMLLDHRPPFALSCVSRHSNYTLYEDWLLSALQASL